MTDSPTDTSAPASAVRQTGGAVWWRVVWAGLVALAAAGLALAFGGLPPLVWAALALAGAPALPGLLLARRGDETGRIGELAGWTLGAGLAAALTGGLAGPLAALCAAPLVVAVLLDGRKTISGGAALSLVLLAVTLWVAVTGAAAEPEAALRPWLNGLSLILIVGALAWGLPPAMARRAVRSERAEEAAARLEALLAGQPHLVVTIDALGQLGSAFGAAPPGMPVDALFTHGLVASAWHPDRAPLQAAILRAATHGGARVGFAPREAPDRWIEADLRRLDDGRLAGVLRDATTQHVREVSLEAARAEAEALNASKSRFLANMSHELRTPLNAVIGFSDIMKQRLFGPMPDKYLEYARLIHESGGHLLALINDVLDMSKIEAERYELSRSIFDGRDPVSAAVRLLRLQAHEGAVSLRAILPNTPVTVEADERAIKQITLNLLSNALKFTPAGGTVTVSVAAHGRMLELTVADTGVGIAPEDVERLGRPYEQAGDVGRRSMGTGLGLSLVRAFAELHGGSLAIESRLGEGAAFTVSLPVVIGAADEPRQGAEIIPLNVGR